MRDNLRRPPCTRPTKPSRPFATHFTLSVVEKGYLGILKWALENGCIWDESTFSNAAGGGHLEMLKWLAENGCPKAHPPAMHLAALGGHLEVLKWLKENDGLHLECQCYISAAARGNLEMMKWLREVGCPRDKWAEQLQVNVICKAAKSGNLEMLKWMNENGWFSPIYAYHQACMVSGSKSVEILKWLRELGCPWDKWSYMEAAKAGNIEALKWLLDIEPVVWTEKVCEPVAWAGQLEVLKWLRAQGCPWNNVTIVEAALISGRVDLLQWVIEEIGEVTWTKRHFMFAATRGHSEVLKWLRAQGCHWNKRLFKKSLQEWDEEHGRTRAVKWAIRNGCDFGVEEMKTAITFNNFGVLKCMLKVMVATRPQEKIAWNKQCCADAARWGIEECWNG